MSVSVVVCVRLSNARSRVNKLFVSVSAMPVCRATVVCVRLSNALQPSYYKLSASVSAMLAGGSDPLVARRDPAARRLQQVFASIRNARIRCTCSRLQAVAACTLATSLASYLRGCSSRACRVLHANFADYRCTHCRCAYSIVKDSAHKLRAQL